MNPIRVATFARSRIGLPSRRQMLHRLAGVALGLGVTRSPGTVEAKKNRRKKRKRQEACSRGERVAGVVVPGTGGTVQTPALTQGQRYRVRASGYWRSNATRGQDAFADFSIVTPSSYATEFEGVRLGLAFDGDSPDLWGSYTTSHEYERVVTGRGTAVPLSCIDKVHDDNTGAVFVEIFCD
jgi:hypothetical protein